MYLQQLGRSWLGKCTSYKKRQQLKGISRKHEWKLWCVMLKHTTKQCKGATLEVDTVVRLLYRPHSLSKTTCSQENLYWVICKSSRDSLRAWLPAWGDQLWYQVTVPYDAMSVECNRVNNVLAYNRLDLLFIFLHPLLSVSLPLLYVVPAGQPAASCPLRRPGYLS